MMKLKEKVRDEEEKLNSSMTPVFKGKGSDKFNQLEAKIKDLRNDLKVKEDKLISTREEFYATKNNLESMKIEVSKMKDNLAETTGELNIERNKAKLLSTQSTHKPNSSQSNNISHTAQSVNLTNQIRFNNNDNRN